MTPALLEIRNKLVAISKGDVVGKPSVLVLDDHKDFTEIIGVRLKQERLWDVYTANTIKEAWEYKVRFDFLIVDIKLDEDRGDMFVREYCRKFPGAKTLLITAYAEFADKDTMMKPFDLEELVAKVKRELAQMMHAQLA
jgi:DNA-binding response OmpR family regulator